LEELQPFTIKETEVAPRVNPFESIQVRDLEIYNEIDQLLVRYKGNMLFYVLCRMYFLFGKTNVFSFLEKIGQSQFILTLSDHENAKTLRIFEANLGRTALKDTDDAHKPYS